MRYFKLISHGWAFFKKGIIYPGNTKLAPGTTSEITIEDVATDALSSLKNDWLEATEEDYLIQNN